ncbi:hypothetical protein [Kitasatospora sp. McL0602]|uniref:hypothetical protein n=1 Tax=Kitasatospora sp. McL0602 TaxID=3439530 RepID=UPI003F8C5B25
MSLQTYLRGHTTEAVDMAKVAYERGRHAAAPRVRAHARAGDQVTARAALGRSEDLLAQVRPGGRDPDWMHSSLGYRSPAEYETVLAA